MNLESDGRGISHSSKYTRLAFLKKAHDRVASGLQKGIIDDGDGHGVQFSFLKNLLQSRDFRLRKGIRFGKEEYLGFRERSLPYSSISCRTVP